MEDEEEVWSELSNMPAEPPVMRPLCDQCSLPRLVCALYRSNTCGPSSGREWPSGDGGCSVTDEPPRPKRRPKQGTYQPIRPEDACWCWALPVERIRPRGTVVILQHPAEQRRALQTARVLQLGLTDGSCLLYRGKRFPQPSHNASHEQPPLQRLLERPGAILLYPAANAVPLGEVAQTLSDYTLFIVDGTWPQAKAMVAASPALRALPAVKLSPAPQRDSQYVIRTQPARGCLSTLEAVAEALSTLDGVSHCESLLAPLHALCSHQLRCGAVPHHSADDCSEEAIAAGAKPKLLGRRLARQLAS